MPDIDENRNSEDGLAETSMPTSTPSVSEGMDKGTPRADSSGPKSPDPPQYTGAVPDPETNDTSDDPFHEREVNTQEVQQDTPAPADLGNARDPLEEFDWDDLEQRFCTAMEKFQKKEDQIGREYRQWLEACFLANSLGVTYSNLIGIRGMGISDNDP